MDERNPWVSCDRRFRAFVRLFYVFARNRMRFVRLIFRRCPTCNRKFVELRDMWSIGIGCPLRHYYRANAAVSRAVYAGDDGDDETAEIIGG